MDFDFADKIENAQKYADEGDFETSIKNCGTIMERILRDRARWLRGETTATDLVNLIHDTEKQMGESKRNVCDFGLKELEVFYKKCNLFEHLRKHLASSVTRVGYVDWDKAIDWRNRATHDKDAPDEQEELGLFEAGQMLLWTRMLATDLECTGSEGDVSGNGGPAISEACPRCDSKLEADWSFCPHCGRALAAVCGNCKRPVQAEWRVCPYCEVRIGEVTDEEEMLVRREYALLCRGVWADRELNPEERRFLEQKRRELGLTTGVAREIEIREMPEDLRGLPEYEAALEASLSDGDLSGLEITFLQEKAKRLGIPDEVARSITNDIKRDHEKRHQTPSEV